jgi:hypothetical protein
VATYKDVELELAEVDAKLKSITIDRTVAQIDAAIAAVLARPVMSGERIRGTVGKLSNSCTKEDRVTTDACHEVASLREERAAAHERAVLESRKATLRAHISTLRDSGGALAADPLAELFSWLSRGQLSVRDIAFGFPLFLAFLIEIVSAFGPAGIVAYADATRRTRQEMTTTRLDTARHDGLMLAAASDSEQGRVVDWMAERTEPTASTSAITIEELHADYQVWCHGRGLHAITANAFVEEFDRVREAPELSGKIRKFGSRYYGIRLVNSNVARLSVRKK